MATGSTKFKNSINIEPQSSDPSSPAEGDIFVSDGTSRAAGAWQYISGAWSEFGGGGSGGINYMTDDNTNAENGIGDWVRYDDSATATVNPTDGTGTDTALNLTFAQNTTTPLRETGDFKFTKDAANRQGEGVSCAFTIDNADKGKKLTISFDYDASDTDYADDDIRISVYDVTNSNLIRINGEDLKASSLPKTHYAQFQAASDSTSYRLIIHQSSTNAAAYDIYFDNIKVGPTNISKGTIATDWKSYTPTIIGTVSDPTKATSPDIDLAWYRRVGDSLEIQYTYKQSATTGSGSGSGVYVIKLPDGLSIDTTKHNVDNNYGENIVGNGLFSTNSNGLSATTFEMKVHPYSTGLVLSLETSSGGALQNARATWGSSAYPFTAAANLGITIKATVPIQGWSSDAKMSSDLGGREIVVRGAGNGGTSITSDTTDIDFTEVEDTSGSWDGSAFIAPETGNYVISGSLLLTGATDCYVKAFIDGTYSKAVSYSISENIIPFDGIINLNKGESLTFRINATATLSNSTTAHWIHIQKLASPQTMLETETVAARYTTDAGQSIPNTTNTTIVYKDIEYDTHNAYNISTGVYTVPVTGIYSINAVITWGALNVALSKNSIIKIKVNGTVKDLRYHEFQASATVTTAFGIDTSIELIKGDSVIIEVYQDSGGAETLEATSNYNNFSIARIK